MKKTVTNGIAKFIRQATLAVACAAFLVSAAYGQSGRGSNTVPVSGPQKSLTNADVVSLLADGQQEQAILDRIRNHPATFDVSNQARANFDRACAGIKHPGVPTSVWATEIRHVWDTMVNVVICQQTNGRGGEGACDLTSPQSSPKNTSAGPTPTDPKVPGRSKYDAITLERGVTQDTGFANWANSGQAPNNGSPSTVQNPSFGQAPVPRAGVTKLAPTRTSPQRDAAPLADTATKAKTKLKLEAQFAAFRNAKTSVARVPTKTAALNVREIQALKRQKVFVDALRSQGKIAPLKAPAGQLGGNLTTTAANSRGAIASPMLLSGPNRALLQQGASSSATQSGSSGSALTTGGTIQLQGSATPAAPGAGNLIAPQPPTNGANLTKTGAGTLQLQGSVTAPPQQPPLPPAAQPKNGGLNVGTGGTLQLGGSSNTNPATSAPTRANPVLLSGSNEPAMQQAPTSQLQHPATPGSPIGANVTGTLSTVRMAAGSVGGYVFWDTSQLHYQLSSPCQGLEVTLSAVTNGGLQKLASSTTFTTPFGSQPVWNFSGQGAQGPWMVCSYVFHQVPEGVPLETDAAVSQSSAFNTPVTLFAEHAPLLKNQFVIPGGNCNTTPDSTLAVVLNSGSVLCGDNAFNVNFAGQNARLNVALTNSNICLGTQIYTVNGVNSVENASNPVVFTQDPAYNDYIITGCGFSSGEGGQVYLSGAITGGKIHMIVLQWSPTQIEAVVQWGLTGVLDGWPDLIVVPPGGGTPGKFPNCRFYAQRQSVLLPNIPQQYAHLANEQVGDGTHGFGTMYCAGPYPGLGAGRDLFPCIAFNYGYPLDGITNNPSYRGQTSTAVSNAVDRDGAQVKFDPGEDVYDFSYLAPGFVIDYFGVRWYTWSQSACDDWRINEMVAGDTVNWSYQGRLDQYFQRGTQIVVDWPVDYCTSYWLGLFKDFEYYNSGYSLEVHVSGPIGVDPWTGQPTSPSH
jgi:hypothetical protein